MKNRLYSPKSLAHFVIVGSVGLVLLAGCSREKDAATIQQDLVTSGHASYQLYCSSCHGDEAKGDGPVAEYLTIRPSDLTRIAERNGRFPENAVFNRIDGSIQQYADSSEQMPHWGIIWRGTDPDFDASREVRKQIDDLISYLESIQVISS